MRRPEGVERARARRDLRAMGYPESDIEDMLAGDEVPEEAPTRPTVVCAWCDLTLVQGDPERDVSHGICRGCKAALEEE